MKYKNTKYTIIYGIDELSGTFLEENIQEFENLQFLISKGSYTSECRSVIKTDSLSNWIYILTGTDPSIHGVIDNKWKRHQPYVSALPNIIIIQTHNNYDKINVMIYIFQNIFTVIRKNYASNITLDAYYDWDGIDIILQLKEYLNVSKFYEANKKEEMVQEAFDYIAQYKSIIMFIHYDGVDEIGHKYVFGKEYVNEIKIVDKKIGNLIQLLKTINIYEETLILIVSDYGRKESVFSH